MLVGQKSCLLNSFIFYRIHFKLCRRPFYDTAMVLGKLPVPGRPTNLITVGQGPIALAVGAGGGCSDICTLLYFISPLSPSLWETARYRLKYCLKGSLNPKQQQQQHMVLEFWYDYFCWSDCPC